MRRAGIGSVHGSDGADKTDAQDEPRVGSHEPVAPSVHVQRPGGDTNDADSESGVQECVVEVGALKGRHAAVFTRLAVEDEVDGQQSSSEDGATVHEALRQVATGGDGVVCILLVTTTERLLEGVT